MANSEKILDFNALASMQSIYKAQQSKNIQEIPRNIKIRTFSDGKMRGRGSYK